MALMLKGRNLDSKVDIRNCDQENQDPKFQGLIAMFISAAREHYTNPQISTWRI
jgi:hypothetical protein